MKNISLKKIFLYLVIFALSISAIFGILIFLFGSFTQTQIQILGTTLSLAIASVACLAEAQLINRNYGYFAYVGFGVIIATFISTLFLIWYPSINLPEGYYKLQISLYILTFSVVQSSLVLLVNSLKRIVTYSLLATLVSITALAILTIYIIVSPGSDAKELIRYIGSIAILDALGTIVTPILGKVSK